MCVCVSHRCCHHETFALAAAAAAADVGRHLNEPSVNHQYLAHQSDELDNLIATAATV